MHLAPHPSWYLFDADGPAPLGLLTDDGHADPSLSATPHGPLAALTEALHATGQHLSTCADAVVASVATAAPDRLRDPISRVDPMGLCPMCLALAGPFVITAADVAIGATIAEGAYLVDRMLSSGLPQGFWPGGKRGGRVGCRNGIGVTCVRYL